MKVPNKVTTTAKWGTTQRVFVVSLLSSLVIFGLIAWYYVVYSRPTIDASAESVKEVQPMPISEAVPNNETRERIVDIESVITSDGTTQPTTTVKIDGEQMNVPPGGSEHRVIQGERATTTVDVSTKNSSTAGKSSNSSTTIIESNSSTEISSSSKSSQSIP